MSYDIINHVSTEFCARCDETDPAKLHTTTATSGTVTITRTLCGPCIYDKYL